MFEVSQLLRFKWQ